MLLIEQFNPRGNAKSNMVSCPVCKKGRLFDKPAQTKVKTSVSDFHGNPLLSCEIYVKCPKCASQIKVTLAQ